MQPCPRQTNEATLSVQLEHQSHWTSDGTCSYCGSMSPGQLFAAISAGAEIGPTDKNYKIYVRVVENTYRMFVEGTLAARVEYAQECRVHLAALDTVRAIRGATKFYFQHFNEDEKKRFVELINAKGIVMGYPGHFYRLPYFVVPLPPVPNSVS